MLSYEHNREEWLEMRRNKIGASDAPVIMGVSPWMTPYQLWEQKLKLRPDTVENESMRRGKEMEPLILEEFQRSTGLEMTPQVVVEHPDLTWMMATLDGIDVNQTSIVETKYAGKKDHEMALSGKIPEKYVPQLHHQLEIVYVLFGILTCHYVSYNEKFDYDSLAIVPVTRNESASIELIEKEKEFWDCMQNMKQPALVGRDYETREDDLWRLAAEEWIKCQQDVEEAKAKEEEWRERLMMLSGDKNTRGAGVTLTRVLRKGSVDYNAIPELRNVDLDKYRKSAIESWRLTKKNEEFS